MKQHVTVVPSDHLVFVDGIALRFDFSAPKNMHALQWHNGKGEIEYDNANNTYFTQDKYEIYVAPFVTAWENEKARLESEATASEEARIAEYNSEEARAARVREKRDQLLADSSWIVERHRDQLANGDETTLTEEQYNEWLAYRQALRDLPQQEGFPWLGGGDDDDTCPWPAMPDMV